MKADLGKLVAAAVGMGLCLLALSAWGLPTSGSPPGLDLRLIVAPPGELTVDPAGVLASTRAMQAGDDPAEGVIEVKNIAGRRLLIHPIALPSMKGLAQTVRLRAATAGKTIAAGTLASLERSRGSGIELPAHGSRRIEVSAWMPPEAIGYRGRILDVTLELRSRPLTDGR
jgi:hypothetical protein